MATMVYLTNIHRSLWQASSDLTLGSYIRAGIGRSSKANVRKRGIVLFLHKMNKIMVRLTKLCNNSTHLIVCLISTSN